MLTRRLFVIAFALFTVTLNTACPMDIAKQIEEENRLTKEYNDKAEEANSIISQLNTKYRV